MKRPPSKAVVWIVAGLACGFWQPCQAQPAITNSPIRKTAFSLDVGALWRPTTVTWALCTNATPPQFIYNSKDNVRGIAYNGPCAEYPFSCGTNNILFVASLKRDVRDTDWRGDHFGSWKLLCEAYLTNTTYRTNITTTYTNRLVCTNQIVCTNRLECTNQLICHDEIICTNELVCTNWVDCVPGEVICTNALVCSNWVDCVPGDIICTNETVCTNEVICQTNWNGQEWVVDCFTNTYCWTNVVCYTNLICNTNTDCWTTLVCYTNWICNTNTYCWTNVYCYTNTICDTNTFCWTNLFCYTNLICRTNRVAIRNTNVTTTVQVTTNATLLAGGAMKGTCGSGTHRVPLIGRAGWMGDDTCSDCAHFEGYLEGTVKYPPTPAGTMVPKLKASYAGNFVVGPPGQIPFPWATNMPITCPTANLPAGPVQMTIEGIIISPCQ